MWVDERVDDDCTLTLGNISPCWRDSHSNAAFCNTAHMRNDGNRLLHHLAVLCVNCLHTYTHTHTNECVTWFSCIILMRTSSAHTHTHTHSTHITKCIRWKNLLKSFCGKYSLLAWGNKWGPWASVFCLQSFSSPHWPTVYLSLSFFQPFLPPLSLSVPLSPLCLSLSLFLHPWLVGL